MARLITFGEIMIRLQTKAFRRFRQSLPGDMEAIFGGAEANVAASYALLGGSAAFVTALPENPIADACLDSLQALGVDVSNVMRSKNGRMGIYFVETGANQRPSNVIYDRDHSSVSIETTGGYRWIRLFKNADWFHVTGITPALSKIAAQVTVNAVRKAKKAGLTVSCDLNFRKKLWHWKEGTSPNELAGRVMGELLRFVDILIANEEDVGDVFGIKENSLDTAGGAIDVTKYPGIAAQVAQKFPNIKKIAFTLRESISATHNNWGCMLYDTANGAVHFAPCSNGSYSPYRITNIVDRIGGGDSFCAALIYALQDDELKQDDEKSAAFAAAASCLCHSIYGDINYSTKDEVLTLMKGGASGRIVR